MKPTVRNIVTEGNLGGRKITMTIDNNSMSQVMGFMADLYSDPAAAVIREYTTNAIDSHLKAGQTRPVELHTPSSLSPVFVVEDFGVGLSEDDIENIYSQFGNSTKRDSNLEAGTFGLGSKSGMTYTEQFTLTATKDGRTIVVLISRDADGTGAMNIIANMDSEGRPNGVRIEIPVASDAEKFRKKVYEFAKYVAPGMVTVDGEVPEQDFIRISDDLAIRLVNGYNYHDGHRVVMGHVAYPVRSDLISIYNSSVEIIHFADVGDVDLPPSREQLMYTPKTEAYLKNVKAGLMDEIFAWANTRVSQAKTKREAFLIARQYWDAIRGSNNSFTYKGEKLPSYIEVRTASVGHDYRASWGHSTLGNSRSLERAWIGIEGFSNSRFTKVQAMKIAEFFEQNDLTNGEKFILDVKLPHTDFIEYSHIFNWEDIKKATAKPRQPRPKGQTVQRKPGEVKKWDGYRGKAMIKGFQIPDEKTIYYSSRKHLTKYPNLFKSVMADGVQFFYVTDGEKQRFLKQVPHAVHLDEGLKKFVRDYLDNMTIDDLNYFKYYESRFGYHLELKPGKVDDPDLDNVFRYSGTTTPQRNKHVEALQAWRHIGRPKDMVFPSFDQGIGLELKRKYPLIALMSYRSWDSGERKMVDAALYDYANTVYKRSKEKVEEVNAV